MGIETNYAWNAKDYAKNSTNQYAWAQELIPKLNLSGKEALLDIGCGDGKITAELSKALPHCKVVGIDSSQEMINLAKTTFPQKKFANLSFQQMDARKLTFQACFERFFSNAALHWIVDQKAVLFGVQRSLKTSGRLLFQMAGKGNAQDVLGILDEMLVEASWKGFFGNFTFPYGFFDIDEYKAFLVEAGLVPERVELLPRDMKLAGAEGLAGWIRTTWLPFTERLSEELRVDFIKEVVARYL